ncbi:MAG: LamG domain-containing protein, partial [Chloroflexota bacterium]
MQTRSGNTSDSTDGTWEGWKPVTATTNILSLQDANTHTDWTATNVMVSDGDVVRNVNYFEDEDESVPGNITKIKTSPFYPNTTGTLENALSGYWPLNEASGTRNDVKGTSHLTANGTGGVGSGTGKVSNAADFESTESDFLEVADNTTLSTGDIDFTVSAWVKLESESAGTTQEVIVSKSDSAGVREYELYYTGATEDSFRFTMFNSGGSIVCNTIVSPSPSVGTWYFLTAWHDSAANTCSISVDNGTPVSAAETGVSSDTTSNFRVGAQYTTEQEFFDGLIDEVGFWKKVLSSQERTDLYNSGNANSYSTSSSYYAEATITAADISSYDYVAFWVRSTAVGNTVKIGFGEAAATEQEKTIYVDKANSWRKVYWNIRDIAAASRNGVTKLRITALQSGVSVWFDNITAEVHLTTSSGSTITSTANNYIQYRAVLTSTDATVAPVLSKVRINLTNSRGAFTIDADNISQLQETKTLDQTTETDQPISLDSNNLDVGTGADGPISVTGTSTINVNNLISGRACNGGSTDTGDAPRYSVTAFASDGTYADVSPAPSTPSCVTNNDEILLINLEGSWTSSNPNLGNWETLRVSSVVGSRVYFKTPKIKYYGSGASDDSGIGTTNGTQRVMLQRVPNYTDVTIGAAGNFSPSAWNGSTGGVMFFRATGTVSVAGGGILHSAARGWQGGATYSTWYGGNGG